MKLLDRYLLGQFVRHFLLIQGSLVAIYLLVDFFERIDNFLERHLSIDLAAKYFFFKVPIILDQLLPVGILLAGVTTLGLLNHSREMMALKTGGISLLRIIRPLALGAVLLTLAGLALAQWVLPPSLSITNRIWYEEVQNRVPRGVDRNGRIYYRGEQGIYSFVRPDPRESRFLDFSYLVWDAQFELERLITARTARWEEGRWLLRQGQIKRKGPAGDYPVKMFADLALALPETPADLFLPEYKKMETSLSHLLARAHQDGFRQDGEAWLELHRRLSYIFLGLPLLLLGLPFLLTINQKWGRDLTLAIPLSCGLAFTAWGWWSVMQSLAASAYLNPVLASWSIHFLAGGAGMFALVRQNR